jgi:transcription initiation factor TFIIB
MIAIDNSKKCVQSKKHKNSRNITSMQLQKHEEKSVQKKTNTKKKKVQLSIVDKDKLWDIFDKDVETIEQSNPEIEMIYDGKSEESGLCKLCSSTLIIMEDGFPTCTNSSCSIIYKNTLDYSPEWRFFGADDKNANDPTRCGNPINPLLMESSFGCKLLCNTKSSYEMKKISKWTSWQSMPHKEKALYDEFQFITIMAQNSGIPKIFIDDAIAIHKDISEQKMFRGLNRDGIKSASIYISCSKNENPRTSKEIASIFKLDNKSATRGCKNALSILNDIEENDDKTVLHNTTPSSFINRYCSKLSINQELTQLCLFIASIVEKQKLIPENTPHSISAGIVYYVCQKCNLNINKKSINQISKISEVTINKCFKKLESFENQLIPGVIMKKYNIA